MNTHIWYRSDLPESHIIHLNGIKIIRLYRDRSPRTLIYPVIILYATSLEGVYNIQNQYYLERIKNIENLIKVRNIIEYSCDKKENRYEITKCKDIYGTAK